MPTPFGVNYLLQFLYNCLENLPIFENKNLKVDIHPICPFLYFSQPIGISVFRVIQYILFDEFCFHKLVECNKVQLWEWRFTKHIEMIVFRY